MIWDVLAKKDHTYHLSEQEYIYYKNKWWLHFNKSGSDTPTIEKTFWFLASVVHLGTFRQEPGKEPYVPTYSHKHKQWQSAQSSTWWKWPDSWWSSKNPKIQGKSKQKFWEGTVRPVIDITLAKTSEDGSQEFNSFCYRWIVDS